MSQALKTTIITPAKKLRSITHLPIAILADLFEVSRTTYYKWMSGVTPHNEHFQHLIDVLIHIEDAQKRLPASVDLSIWLRTPISSGAKTPLDYLHNRKFSIFCGLILREKSTNMKFDNPIPLPFPGPMMSSEERKIARERTSPLPRIEIEE